MAILRGARGVRRGQHEVGGYVVPHALSRMGRRWATGGKEGAGIFGYGCTEEAMPGRLARVLCGGCAWVVLASRAVGSDAVRDVVDLKIGLEHVDTWHAFDFWPRVLAPRCPSEKSISFCAHGPLSLVPPSSSSAGALADSRAQRVAARSGHSARGAPPSTRQPRRTAPTTLPCLAANGSSANGYLSGPLSIHRRRSAKFGGTSAEF